jgi:hypothetical protein
MARAKVDFQIVNHGTIYLLYPNTRPNGRESMRRLKEVLKPMKER